MSVQNDALLLNIALDGYPTPQEIFANAAAISQAAALPIISPAVRVVTSLGGNNFSLVLPDIGTGAASCSLMFVINDSPNTILVFPFVNAATPQQMNGVNNASLSIATGLAGVFSLLQSNRHGRGGGVASPVNGWRGAVMP